MINEDNLKMLYNSVLESDTITTKKLNEMGFNSKDITKLIKENKIERLCRGIYKVTDTNELFKIAKKLFWRKKYIDSCKTYEYIYELDKTNASVILQLFSYAIRDNRYDDAYKYLDNLFLICNEDKKKIINLYLLLLSNITKIPERYQDYLTNLKLEDLRFNSNDKFTSFIECVYRKDFIAARKELYDKFDFNLSYTHDISALLSAIVHNNSKKEDNNKQIGKNKEGIIDYLGLIVIKNYEKLIEILNFRSKKIQLNFFDENILKLANVYVNLKNTHDLSNLRVSKSINVFNCINDKDYFRALEISKRYNKEKSINDDTDCLYLVLYDICELINIIKEENNRKNNIDNLYNLFTTNLINIEFPEAVKYLRECLNLVDKKEYEFIIINLIKIDLLEDDYEFTKSLNCLNLIINDKYIFNEVSYINDFYKAIIKRDYKLASFYFSILEGASKIGCQSIDVADLRKTLESIKKEKLEDSDNLQTNFSQPVKPFSGVSEKENTADVNNEVSQNKKEQEGVKNIKYKRKENYIAKLHNKIVESKSAILLDKMSEQEKNIVLELAKKYDDIAATYIEVYGMYYVVLKYKERMNVYVNHSEVFELAIAAYQKKNYKLCVNLLLPIFNHFDKPNLKCCAYLGLAYLKLNRLHTAIDYLRIATILSKRYNYNYDFSNLIDSIVPNKSIDEEKPTLKQWQVSSNLFKDDEYYGVGNFLMINDCIIKSKLDIVSACLVLGFNKEKILLILLIYAREFFLQGWDNEGEKLLKIVERSENKSTKILKVINEIRRNKNLYQYRNLENHQYLDLNLIVKKLELKVKL